MKVTTNFCNKCGSPSRGRISIIISDEQTFDICPECTDDLKWQIMITANPCGQITLSNEQTYMLLAQAFRSELEKYFIK